MIPQIGQRFTVSFKKMKYTFDAVILRMTEDGLYELKTFNRVGIDIKTGIIDRKPEDVIEVEARWFDTEETGRIITIHEHGQLTLI